MFSINKYCQNFKPGIPLSKDFRNEVIQMAATRPISEILYTSKVSYVPVVLTALELQMFGYQACHVCAQLEHVLLSRVHA